MNQTVSSIIERHSIRKFKPEQITDEELNQFCRRALMLLVRAAGNHQ